MAFKLCQIIFVTLILLFLVGEVIIPVLTKKPLFGSFKGQKENASKRKPPKDQK